MKALRGLDAATPPTFEQYERAAATLDRIVATRPDPPRRQKPFRTWMLVPALAAAVAVLLLVAPWGKSGRAYATWTPTPVALTPAESGRVGSACQDRIGSGMDFDRAELALAERRGEYVALLYRHDNPGTAFFCLAHNMPGTDDVDDVKVGGGSGSESFDTAAPDQFKEGALSVYPEGITITEGAAGADVAGLTIHTDGLSVQATVRNGHWVAWWPAKALVEDGQGQWRDVPRTYDVLLNDGRTIKDAKPAR